MKKNSAQEAPQSNQNNRIKVKLDDHTFVFLGRQSSLKIWKRRYPNATIVEETLHIDKFS